MKKRIICGSFLSFFILGLFLAMPGVVAVDPTFTPPEDSPCGWASLSDVVTDAADDVVRYTTTAEKGVVGDFHDEIDIINISSAMMAGLPLSLVIFFADTPCDYQSYNYFLFIDNNTDGHADYVLYSNISLEAKVLLITFYLQRVFDGNYWDGDSWVGSEISYPGWGIYGNTLSFPNFNLAITEMLTSRVAAVAAYTGDGTYLFADFVPLTPEAGIPGFSFGLVLFGGLMLLGMIIILQREKIRI